MIALLKKIFRRYLSYLEKKGRKFVVVSYTGEILGYRYFPFYPEDITSINRYPNIVLHHWVSPAGVDNQMIHSHPWGFLSIMVKGGYSEFRNNKWRERRAPAFILMSAKDTHGIREVIPNSYTIFIHGFETNNWLINSTYQKTKDVSANESTVSVLKAESDTTHTSNSKWKGIIVAKFTPEMEKKISLRQRAFAKISNK